jgi:NAD(P)H-dependent flavin oxidoreductase YrpB (nitropropane dioxygenase family)
VRTKLCDELGIELPVFAFTYEPAVAAAVSRHGGMGVLGAVRFSTDELAKALEFMDAETAGRPYGVDVVMPASSAAAELAEADDLLAKLDALIPDEHRAFIERILDEHDVPPLPEGETPPRGLLGWTDRAARSQVEVALSHPIGLLANALGPPPADVVADAHEHDVRVAALVGRTDQARKQRDQGVDIIVAQGTEAGGHTGDVATMVLVPEVVEAVAPAPVLAAGGIGRGRQIAAALALGAQGVWTGSVWLTTAEHSQQEALRRKLLAATSSDTVRSRSFTGKPARQLRTAWTEAWDDPGNPKPLALPLQYLLTAEAQHRIRLSGKEELLGIPVGQIIGSVTEVRSVAEVLEDFKQDYRQAVERLEVEP